MYKLMPKDWADILRVNDLQSNGQLQSSHYWRLEHLWRSLLNGQVYAGSAYKIKSIVCFRETLVSFEVDFLKTHKQHRGEGCMSSNFSYLKIIAEMKSLPIWLEVSCKNLSAIKFYEYQGFEFCALRKNYYKNGENARIYTYFPTK